MQQKAYGHTKYVHVLHILYAQPIQHEQALLAKHMFAACKVWFDDATTFCCLLFCIFYNKVGGIVTLYLYNQQTTVEVLAPALTEENAPVLDQLEHLLLPWHAVLLH